MHIPDGFLSPITYAPLLVAEAGFLYYAFKKTLKVVSDDSAMPFLASMSAFSFVIMMFNVPIPGGTSGHATGVAVLAILFGPWIAVFCLSVVLLLQAVLFGDGGILAFGANAISMGVVGAFTASLTYTVFSKFANKKISYFAAGYFSIVASSVCVAVLLGIQPIFFTDDAGRALYFPLGLNVSIPALVGSHALFFGVLEGIVTMAALSLINKINVPAFRTQK